MLYTINEEINGLRRNVYNSYRSVNNYTHTWQLNIENDRVCWALY